jgi:hypothetical protein
MWCDVVWWNDMTYVLSSCKSAKAQPNNLEVPLLEVVGWGWVSESWGWGRNVTGGGVVWCCVVYASSLLFLPSSIHSLLLFLPSSFTTSVLILFSSFLCATHPFCSFSTTPLLLLYSSIYTLLLLFFCSSPAWFRSPALYPEARKSTARRATRSDGYNLVIIWLQFGYNLVIIWL